MIILGQGHVIIQGQGQNKYKVKDNFITVTLENHKQLNYRRDSLCIIKHHKVLQLRTKLFERENKIQIFRKCL